MSRADERSRAVRDTVDRIRARAETGREIDRQTLHALGSHLVELARRRELFPRACFPATGDADRDTHLLSCDDDGRYALYLFSSAGDCETPPHDHATWAVIAGIEGTELNRLYRRAASGGGEPEFVREIAVGPREGLCLMPEDVHAIASPCRKPLMHLHMYGLAFEHQEGRTTFDERAGAHSGIASGRTPSSGRTPWSGRTPS